MCACYIQLYIFWVSVAYSALQSVDDNNTEVSSTIHESLPTFYILTVCFHVFFAPSGNIEDVI